MTALQKPTPRPKKTPKPLRRTSIKPGRRCRECCGSGMYREWTPTGGIAHPCGDCSGTGRIASASLKRSALPKRMKDDAEFKRADIEAIWQPYVCPLTGLRPGNSLHVPIDMTHILGRHNGDYIYSSPLNHSPLARLIHAYGNRDHRYIRAFLLLKAREAVDEAIRDGRYVPNAKEAERDAMFTEVSADLFPNLT